MGAMLRPKNWASFQHYKDRAPPWIKLHRALLDDYDFACLPLASKALAPLLWLLAAESVDGHFTGEVSRLAHRLRWSDADLFAGLKPLIDKGFFEIASGVLADCLQRAIPETETETETETKSLVRQAAPKRAERFDEWWRAYPNKKGDKEATRKKWAKLGLDEVADNLLGHLVLMQAQDAGWQDGYIPMAATYINQQRWNDVPKRRASNRAEPSKGMAAILNLEAMKHGTMDGQRGHHGFAEAGVPVAGLLASDGHAPRNRWGVDGCTDD